MSDAKTIVANNTPIFGWVFMFLWMAMLCVFTWLAIRDGGIPGHSHEFSALIFGLFWIFGVGGCRFMLSIPRVRASAGADGLRLEEIWLWKKQSFVLGSAAAQQLRIVDDKDDDGAPYFKCEVRLPDDRVIVLKESHAREAVEGAHRALIDAIRD